MQPSVVMHQPDVYDIIRSLLVHRGSFNVVVYWMILLFYRISLTVSLTQTSHLPQTDRYQPPTYKELDNFYLFLKNKNQQYNLRCRWEVTLRLSWIYCTKLNFDWYSTYLLNVYHYHRLYNRWVILTNNVTNICHLRQFYK